MSTSVVSDDRATEVKELHEELNSIKAVANQMGLAESTVKRYLRASDSSKKSSSTPTNNKVEVEKNGNQIEVTSRSDRITTLDELIEEANIDLDVWEIERHVINKWDGQRAGGEPVPLWQVKAWLTKKTLTEKEFEPVQPINLDFNYNKPNRPTNAKINKAVVIPDLHIGYRRDSYTKEMIPFHDRRCLDLDLQLIKDVDPDLVILLGDFLDMPNWSKKFIRSPEFANILQASVDEGHWWLRNIREIVPNSKVVLLQGNHEERLPRFLKSNNKSAYGVKPATSTKDDPDLLSVPNLLDLPSLQIDWVGKYPDGGFWVNDNLVAEHGSRTSSVNGKSAGQILDEARESHLFGHTHRLEMATTTAYPKSGPKMYQSVSLGCQCRIGGEVPGTKKKQDWQNAVGVVEFKEGNNPFYIKPIFINNGSMIYNGKKYDGENRLDQLKEEAKIKKYNFVEY